MIDPTKFEDIDPAVMQTIASAIQPYLESVQEELAKLTGGDFPK